MMSKPPGELMESSDKVSRYQKTCFLCLQPGKTLSVWINKLLARVLKVWFQQMRFGYDKEVK